MRSLVSMDPLYGRIDPIDPPHGHRLWQLWTHADMVTLERNSGVCVSYTQCPHRGNRKQVECSGPLDQLRFALHSALLTLRARAASVELPAPPPPPQQPQQVPPLQSPQMPGFQSPPAQWSRNCNIRPQMPMPICDRLPVQYPPDPPPPPFALSCYASERASERECMSSATLVADHGVWGGGVGVEQGGGDVHAGGAPEVIDSDVNRNRTEERRSRSPRFIM